jgi:hypothetical protein
MPSEQNSLIERVESSYRKLSTVASELNFVSDELGKCVSEMDSALKKLNLGIEVWVLIRGNQDDVSFWTEELGYQKISGKWGIALRTVAGVNGCEDEADVERWLFNDAPRWLRLSAIAKIPVLLEQLSMEGTKVADEISKSLADVKEVATVLSKAAEEPVKRIIARGYKSEPEPAEPLIRAFRHIGGDANIPATGAARYIGGEPTVPAKPVVRRISGGEQKK